MVKVYFQNGQVIKTVPSIGVSYYENRDLINNAERIVSDGIEYDLTDRASIYSIEIPVYVYEHTNRYAQELGVAGYLEYVLRMHAGGLWNEGRYDLAIPCLAKATQLMLYSTVGWQRDDFYRIVDWNIELGRFSKALEWEEWIEKNVPTLNDIQQDSFNSVVDSCSFLDTDLVEVGDSGACCSLCAKYRNRIYSLSGRDKRFPKFPKDFHMDCGLHISPFVYGVSEPTFNAKHYVLYSRRPFMDDRTAEEKANYIKRVEEIEEAKRKTCTTRLNRIIYYYFKPIFPDAFPKSLSAFSRMRNANTKTYQKLVSIIENAGYRIPQSLQEAAEWEGE